MKKVALVLMAVVLVASVAIAQDMPAAKMGAKSLNFTFGGFGGFGLTGSGPNPTGAAAGISVTHFMADDAALRIGLQVAGASSTTAANATAPDVGTDGSSSSLNLGLGVDYLMYSGTGRVRPYMGAGIGLGWGTNTTKGAVIAPTVQVEVKDNPAAGPTGISFGLTGIIGAEWFLYNDLSFSAEYNLNIITVNSPADLVSGTTTTKQGSSTSFLGFGAAGATVHIYW